MTTMFGRNSQRNLIDFLADPAKAHSVIERHKEAVRNHAIAAEDYKSKKAEALIEIERLKQYQQVHSATERQLSDKHQMITELRIQVDQASADIELKTKALEDDKLSFEKLNLDFQNRNKQYQQYVTQQDENISQRYKDLSLAEASFELKMKELNIRESKLMMREQAIKDLVMSLQD